MTRQESKWQLLLVADDGRIVPFQHVKALALTLVGLLVIFGLATAFLGWQFVMEKERHLQTREKLAVAKEQTAHFKSEHERRTAELVLAKARLEQFVSPSSKESVAGTDKSDASMTENRSPGKVEKKQQQGADLVSSGPPVVQPTVALKNFKVSFDVRADHVTAQLRVQNTGSRSVPAEGRCVVVLKTDDSDPVAWFAMPDVPLSKGQPDGKGGSPFRISRYIDMNFSGAGPKNPSRYKRATVFVFDRSGKKMLEEQYRIEPPVPLADPPVDAAPNEKEDVKVPASSSPDPDGSGR